VFVLEDGRIKVLDLGLAQLGAAPDEPRRVAGTPGYMAPEQLRGAPVDARADVWSLGVILRELLTGEPASPRATTSSVPIAAELEAVIARATAPEPSDRFAGAGELLDALLAAGRSLSAGGSPYRYLEAFTEDDAEWFFGRAEETTRLAQMVAARPLVALVGPSGAGKSSLVRAGLAHRLRSEGPVAVLAVRPSRDPLRALEIASAPSPAGWPRDPSAPASSCASAPGAPARGWSSSSISSRSSTPCAPTPPRARASPPPSSRQRPTRCAWSSPCARTSCRASRSPRRCATWWRPTCSFSDRPRRGDDAGVARPGAPSRLRARGGLAAAIVDALKDEPAPLPLTAARRQPPLGAA
jgi:serine/threonine protein kinase